MMFGPTDKVPILLKHELEDHKSNDELRQGRIDKTVPQAEFLGLTLPDKQLEWDEKTATTDLERSIGKNSITY